MRIVSPRKSCSFSIVSGCIETTELSSLIASSTTSRFGDFLRSRIAVEKSFFAPFLEHQQKRKEKAIKSTITPRNFRISEGIKTLIQKHIKIWYINSVKSSWNQRVESHESEDSGCLSIFLSQTKWKIGREQSSSDGEESNFGWKPTSSFALFIAPEHFALFVKKVSFFNILTFWPFCPFF